MAHGSGSMTHSPAGDGLRPLQVVSAWAAAGVGCRAGGAGAAWLGTLVEPGLGTAIGGIAGCAVGGFLGYLGGQTVSGYTYDWVAGTTFLKLPPLARI